MQSLCIAGTTLRSPSPSSVNDGGTAAVWNRIGVMHGALGRCGSGGVRAPDVGYFPLAPRNPRQKSVLQSKNPQVDAAVFRQPQDALLTTDSLDLEEHHFNFLGEIEYLQDILDGIARLPSTQQQAEFILATDRATAFFKYSSVGRVLKAQIEQLPIEDAYMLYLLPAINQWEVLSAVPEGGDLLTSLKHLSTDLKKCDAFYDAIGGLLGYQLKVCQLIHEGLKQESERSDTHMQHGQTNNERIECFLQPPSLDLSQDHAAATAAAIEGLRILPEMAEVIPLGGAGDRLGLVCDETGESLPTAMLKYCGRTLLESIIRDVQAREFLYFRVFGQQKTTPIAVMTSDAKGNHTRIDELLKSTNWFGRGSNSFSLFCQPLVPVVSVEDGKWLVPDPLKPLMKPGGHGVIWKLMQDNGVFAWLQSAGRRAALVRQISNPLAGTDTTLLALAGIGRKRQHAFGFASCERAVGAAEGMNVLVEETVVLHNAKDRAVQRRYGITNVEYTEFERLGITDEASGDCASTSMYPANTNILYIGLEQVVQQLQKGFVKGGGAVLPGMIFNTNKKINYVDALTGEDRRVRAGRMECTMQNLADCFRTALDGVPQTVEEATALDTFLVYNLRRRTTSSAKRKRQPGSTRIHQTPDGSYYDLLSNGRELLMMCGVQVSDLGAVPDFLEQGPGFIFLFHPALGPLWDVIRQKIRGGQLGRRAELVLEVAEVNLENLVISDGSSLQIVATNVVGHHGTPTSINGKSAPVEVLSDPQTEVLIYSNRCGRVRMRNVTVVNSGVDWQSSDNCYWAHRLTRHETCKVILHGNAELEATDCVIPGNKCFEVPDGHVLRLFPGPDGSLCQQLVSPNAPLPSWEWKYSIAGDGCSISLEPVYQCD